MKKRTKSRHMSRDAGGEKLADDGETVEAGPG
jgi:hypothetical protein